jgi:glycine/D-amino acid oxidase-like deaminating enzyme
MYDFIIVGQGLAGSAVALQLMERNYQILVIDNPSANHSSRIAAGLFNPVTGRKMVKTWMADTLFPYLNEFYAKVESQSEEKFFHPCPIYRPFLSIEEQNEWMAKSVEEGYSSFIDRVVTQSLNPQLRDPFGGLMLKQGGFLDTASYVNFVRTQIQEHGTFLEDNFDAKKLSQDQQGIRYDRYSAQRIIFCNGVHSNPWFDWLPVRPLKGETLTIATDFHEDRVVNRGIYMVPTAIQGHWRVGATYQFQDNSPEITTPARLELEEKIKELACFSFEVVHQQWGMRPTTPDRRPLLGAHPQDNRLVFFNGLGTKGVSLAPYFAKVLIHWLENRGSIHKEVDIERYKSLYSSSPS